MENYDGPSDADNAAQFALDEQWTGIPPMNDVLHDRIAFVTGAANGIGLTIVRHFAAAGAKGIAFDISRQFPKLPDGWIPVTGDVSDEAELAVGVETARKHFQRIDIVVANAGVVPPWRNMDSLDAVEWDRVFAVNVRGIAFTIKGVLPLMRETGGSIIAMGSLNSSYGHPKQCLYTASKHAVIGIVRAAALDLGRFNIRVNAIGPGPVATDALLMRVEERAQGDSQIVQEILEDYASHTALGHLTSEADVAAFAVFLASNAATSITGQLIRVDAGFGVTS